MKKFVRILCLTLVAVMLCATLASCGGVASGEYVNGDTEVTKTYTKYTFSGSKVTFEAYVVGSKVGDNSFEGKYKVKDDKITFTWENAEGEEETSTMDFEEKEDGSIKIGLLTYKKVEK